jgi:transposase
MLSGEPVSDLADELGVSIAILHRWKKQALIDTGRRPGIKSYEPDELARARRRIKDLERELEKVKAASALRRALGSLRPEVVRRKVPQRPDPIPHLGEDDRATGVGVLTLRALFRRGSVDWEARRRSMPTRCTSRPRSRHPKSRSGEGPCAGSVAPGRGWGRKCN